MRQILKYLIVLCLTVPFAGRAALCADDALYDAPIPAGSSFVRFLNRSIPAGEVVTMSGESFTLTADVMSPYRLITGADFDISFGGATEKQTIVAGKFYTIALGREENGLKPIIFMEDKTPENPEKAALYVYNFSDKPIDVNARVNGSSKTAFSAVPSGTSAFREVKPIDLGLDVVVSGAVLYSFEDISLTTTDSGSLIAFSSGDTTKATWVKNSIER